MGSMEQKHMRLGVPHPLIAPSPLCGALSGDARSVEWKKVTCKACLKLKKKYGRNAKRVVREMVGFERGR